MISANMGVLGPQYRGKAKAIADALGTVEPGPDGATVTVDGEEFFVPSHLFDISEEEVDVRGEDVRPHVIEPSYGIDRMIYAALEHAFDEEEVDGEIRRVMRFPPRIAPVDPNNPLPGPAFQGGSGAANGKHRGRVERTFLTGDPFYELLTPGFSSSLGHGSFT